MYKFLTKLFAKYFTKRTIDEKNGASARAPPPSSLIKRILPLAAFSVAFAIVMTTLVLYMDNLAMKHQQFRLNMSQDFVFNVSQENPKLITYIRDFHLRPAVESLHKPIEYTATEPPPDTAYVINLLSNKKNGVFIESGAYSDGKTSKTEWLERKLSWRGLLTQADTRHYFNLRRHNRKRAQAVHACLSPIRYLKEVTFHQESVEVKINSVHANSLDEPDWFTTRIKCFPLFSLLMAMNATSVDYFSMRTNGGELEVLETVPFDRVRIEVIGVEMEAGVDEVKKFLGGKKYTFMESFNSSYIFMMNRIKI